MAIDDAPHDHRHSRPRRGRRARRPPRSSSTRSARSPPSGRRPRCRWASSPGSSRRGSPISSTARTRSPGRCCSASPPGWSGSSRSSSSSSPASSARCAGRASARRCGSTRRAARRRRRGGCCVPVLAVALGIEELVPQIHHAATPRPRLVPRLARRPCVHVRRVGLVRRHRRVFVFNTVLGEELLFRGLLLPRMNGVFGRKDWLANGVLFAAYHLHVPWVIPATLLDTFIVAYPAEALPQRAHRHRGAQRPDRVLLPVRSAPRAELSPTDTRGPRPREGLGSRYGATRAPRT